MDSINFFELAVNLARPHMPARILQNPRSPVVFDVPRPAGCIGRCPPSCCARCAYPQTAQSLAAAKAERKIQWLMYIMDRLWDREESDLALIAQGMDAEDRAEYATLCATMTRLWHKGAQ